MVMCVTQRRKERKGFCRANEKINCTLMYSIKVGNPTC
jgi:hypothetical protein